MLAKEPIALSHHFFECHRFGVSTVHLQNKNRFMMYLLDLAGACQLA